MKAVDLWLTDLDRPYSPYDRGFNLVSFDAMARSTFLNVYSKLVAPVLGDSSEGV